MKERTNEILQSLEDAFFGTEYFEHMKIVDSALACRSIKDFRALNIDLLSPEAKSIFKAANFKQTGDILNQAKADHIFKQVKAVRAAVNFI